MRHPIRTTIAARISIIFGLLVFCTALIVYAGGDFRAARLYRSQRETRIRFLARSMSYGIKNLLVSSGSRVQVSRFSDDVLRKAMETDNSILGCLIKDRNGKDVYRFKKAGAAEDSKSLSMSVDILSDKTKIGEIVVYYKPQTVMENEKTQQLIMLGTTVASMVRYYLRRLDFFQVKFLAQKIFEEDRDVLYASISGPMGMTFYEHGAGKFGKYLTGGVRRRAMSVSVVEPILMQDIGFSERYGRMVEVSVLIENNGVGIGVVRIGYSMASLTESLARERLVLGLMVAGLVLAAFGMALALSRNITRPLVELTRLARSFRIEKDDSETRGLEDAEMELNNLREAFDSLGERFAARGDEVGDLATAFQDMINSLSSRISELKTFYRKMSVADRFYAMGQLSAGIAHEINNPLTIISTYVQIMLKRSDLDPELRSELDTIREEIERISEKVKDLLSFAQESKYEYAVSDLHTVLRKSIGLARYKFKKQEIELIQEFDDEDTLEIRIDANKLRQVFLNLILNAAQAMTDSPDRRLTVGTGVSADGSLVEVCFRDTGCGIPEENLKRIFDPFFTTKQAGVGTGLGLSICYSIVTAHGGEILVESEKGKGTIFRIILPANFDVY